MANTDPYSALVDQTAADMVRAMLAHPPNSAQGVGALRAASTLLVAQHGTEGARDLAELLAADVAELFEVVGRREGRPALELLDEWTHDVPPPRL